MAVPCGNVKKKFPVVAKIMALAIAMVMMLSMSISVFATSGDPTATDGSTSTTKTITINNGKAGHTYTLYQIFTGKVEGDELTNLQWGTDAPAAMKTDYATAVAAAKAIAYQNDARAWAQSQTFTGGTAKHVTADGEVKFEGLAEGYYVVVDTNSNTSPVENDFSSAIIVQVVKDVTMDLKGSIPSSEKKVADVNDSEKVQPALADVADADWKDSADYDIGDKVPFELKATTADNVANYKKYHITFQDKQSAGLDAPTSYTITVLGKTFTLAAGGTAGPQTTDNGTKITVSNATPETDYTFAIKVEFEPTAQDAIYLDAECNSKDIIVKYEATLNTNAKIGAAGNPNDSHITYSNNPEDEDGSDEGKTPEDTVIVFTYKTTVDKVDETGAALKGADFALYKEVPQTTTGAQSGQAIKATFSSDAIKTAAAALEDAKYYVVAGQKGATTADTTQFSFTGIDDGTYVLVETAVPTGYNAWAAKKFTVTASHTDGAAPALESLTGTDPFAGSAWSGAVEMTKKDNTKYNTVSGEMYTEIENKSGAELPSTGGIGTTIFYILGAILVLGAGIVLVTRRRMSAN